MIRGRIEINRLKIYAYHGVGEQERIVGNEFEVSVSLTYPSLRVAESDTVPMAINYADVIELVNEQMARPSSLLENVAWRIRQAVVNRYPEVNQGRVKVAKITPPLPCSLAEAAAVIEWD
ncbi:MAG: dihydroneopterin aldolase [Muribaculaceae bacterium]|nr:dihydroneopterin aldolase [Muribaculaceae bacterium]